MRLWHYRTIGFLPTAQLLRQWRECCGIAGTWAARGSPNHALVNRVLQYPIEDFIVYCKLVYDEMIRRGYSPSEYAVAKLKDSFVTIYLYDGSEIDSLRHYIDIIWNGETPDAQEIDIFKGWHNDKYLSQCYFNMEEKYDCGCVPEPEWQRYLEGGKKLV